MQTKSFPIRKMILCSLFIAAQVVLARFVGIQINEGLRVSFETIPLILCACWLGPLWGMVAAVIADILGTIISGYGVYFPLLTVGPVLLTLIIGILYRTFLNKRPFERRFYLLFFGIVIGAEFINMVYGTWALTLYYSIVVGKEMPFGVLFAARIITKPVTIILDTVLSCLLHRTLYARIVTRYLAGGADKKIKEN